MVFESPLAADSSTVVATLNDDPLDLLTALMGRMTTRQVMSHVSRENRATLALA
jgi:hypothetical protein